MTGEKNPVSVEEWWHMTNRISCSERTATVIADIAIKGQVTGENYELQM